MARGSEIIVTSNPRGVQLEGKISGTVYPGTMVEIDPTVAIDDSGRFTFRVYQPGTDGERRTVMILLWDPEQGALATTALTDGQRCKVYCPLSGEEMNIRFGDTSGTADDIAVGDMLICDSGTGEFIETTGTPESEPFQALEVITDPTADQLLWAICTGH